MFKQTIERQVAKCVRAHPSCTILRYLLLGTTVSQGIIVVLIPINSNQV